MGDEDGNEKHGVYPLDKDEVKVYAAEVAAALRHLHKHKVAHRDLKPMNVLLTEDGHAIVSDFGLSAVLRDKPTRKGRVGTPGYMAPEMLRGEPRGVGCDWFSYGVTIYALLTGEPPFKPGAKATAKDGSEYVMQGSYKEITTAFANGEFTLNYPEKYFDEETKSFVQMTMDVNPFERARFSKVAKSDWLKDISFRKAADHQLETKFKPGLAVNAKSVMALYDEMEEDEHIRKNTKLDPAFKKVSFNYVSKLHLRDSFANVSAFKFEDEKFYEGLPTFEKAIGKIASPTSGSGSFRKRSVSLEAKKEMALKNA